MAREGPSTVVMRRCQMAAGAIIDHNAGLTLCHSALQYTRYMIKVENLVWDEWNIAHIARHNIVPDEVEQVCQSDFEVEEADKGKLMVIGLTQAGRMLSVVL